MRYRTCIVDAPFLTRRAFEAGGPDAMVGAAMFKVVQIQREHGVGQVIFAWEARDAGHGMFRREMDEEYKARRKPPPAEYLDAIADLQRMLPLLGVYQATSEAEADDVAYTISSEWSGPHLLWSADKDWLQFVSDARPDPLCDYCHGRGERVWHTASCSEPDFCALAGGPGDCPGEVGPCPCVGEMVHLLKPDCKPRPRDVAPEDFRRPADQLVTPANIVEITGLDAVGWYEVLCLQGDAVDGMRGLPSVGAKPPPRPIWRASRPSTFSTTISRPILPLPSRRV